MIDQIQLARELTASSSLSQQDAEAIVQTAIKLQSAELATKVDIAEVRTDLAKVRADLIYWIVGSVGLSTLVQIAASFLRTGK